MHLVSIQMLRRFWKIHPDAERPLRAWYEMVEQAQWRTPAEIKSDFATASFLSNNRVVFNIKGNDYRIVVIVEYRRGRIFVRFVGTHADYNKIDAERI